MSGAGIHAASAPKAVGSYPHARRVAGLLFLSGIGPRNPATNAIPGNETDVDGRLRSYMTAQVRIVLGRANDVLTIPSAALGARNADGSYSVQIRGADGRASARRITTGLDDQIQVEVRDGLKEGEQVVLAQANVEAASTPAQPK